MISKINSIHINIILNNKPFSLIFVNKIIKHLVHVRIGKKIFQFTSMAI